MDSHLDYGDIIYDKPNNQNFINKLESIQYYAALAITGAIRGSSKERIYQELGLESLSDRRWYRRMCTLWKIINGLSPEYLKKYLPRLQSSRNPIRQKLFRAFPRSTTYYGNSFFPYSIDQWNKLDPEITIIQRISQFKNML